MPVFLDMILAIPLNILRVLFTRCDVVIGLKPFPNTTIPLLFAKLMGRITVVDVDDLDYGYREGILRKIVQVAQGLWAKYADIVTYHNENLHEIVENEFKVPPEKIVRLKQGVDLQLFNRHLENREQIAETLKNRYHIGDRRVLLYTAHLNAGSDLDVVLKAMKKVMTEEQNLVLVVVGGGFKEVFFQEMAKELGIADNVVFTGHQKNTETVKHLLMGDIALLYYKDIEVNKYRCSMKLREYLAMGKVVVCNGAGELKQFTDLTIQAEDDSVDALVKALLYALRNDCSDKARRGAQYAESVFDWKKIGSQFTEYLLNKCKNKGQS